MATVSNEIASTNQLIREHADSSQDLEELFRAAIEPNRISHKPMRERNLPLSFFKPPETGTKSASHSRESSIDQSKYVKRIPSSSLDKQQHIISINQQQLQKMSLLSRAGIQVAHSRAHSSPATLQKTLSAVPPQIQPQNVQTIQSAAAAAVQQQQQQQPTATVQPEINPTAIQHIRQLSDINQIPLPEGWNQAIDQSTGRVYFINHNEKTTTWNDPRLEIARQEQLRLLQLQMEQQQQEQQLQAQLQNVQIQPQRFPQQPQQQPQQIIQNLNPQQSNPAAQQPQPALQQQPINGNLIIQQTKLPDGWEERKTENGQIFYLNHITRSTTWIDPRLQHANKPDMTNRPPPPDMQQQQVIVQQVNEQPAAQQMVAEQQSILQQQQVLLQQQQQQAPQQQILTVNQNSSNESIPNDCQQRVDQLHMEVAKIRKRNNEILNQQQLFSQSMVVNQKENDAAAINHQAHHTSNNLNTAGMDPFLSGENHSRQESADSGLGREYSLPNTPDDMLVLDDEFIGLESLAITSMDLDMEHDDMLPNGMETNYNADILNMPDLDAILAGGSQMNCLE